MSKELEAYDMTRDEAADKLESIAADLRGDGSFDVNVNNRTVHLAPPENIGVEVGVREMSSLLRGSREAFTVKLDWKPE
ncbi:amphi-Trp domain-containing protein [Halosimplex rubrum]|uniref:Amphi-Trp domain-containing protein n=1 Tax=Halosimplex rubrum TaxID=869889 RepID=A0A7D5NYK4_9EURY|nr:amphi-Trp domain-containing protein [Halosimplex rubrum]QLH76486.1 amphi-Trp domain-containing protein [Halosimplex rubrum]